jgi:Restriction endonuclease
VITAMNIADFVTDWGGFEKLVAKLHETGEVTVEHNVVLAGRSGAPRRIDVLIRHKQGLYDHLVVAECKYWNSSVERLHVDALATTVREVGASRGVIFSTKGFQSGAITQAEHEKIDLFVVRDLTAEEWGLPGRVVDLFLQIIQPSIDNIITQNVTKIGNPANNCPIALNIEFGPDGPLSSTPTLNAMAHRVTRSKNIFSTPLKKRCSKPLVKAS